MFRGKKIRASVLAAVFCFTVMFVVFTYGKVKAKEEFEEKLKIYLQAVDLIKNDYVEKNLNDTTMVYGSIRGLLESLDDPYTRFLEPKSFKEMRVRLSGSYSGIGIYIGLKDKEITVISPIEDSPAYLCGLKSGDKIATIDGKSTKHMALDEAVSMIRGQANTVVTLGILRGKDKDTKDYKITRKKIVVKAVKSKMMDNNIGYLKLVTFENQNANSEVKNALKSLSDKGANSLILDLRGNGGGLLSNAIDISNMFIGKGVVVHTVDRDGRKETIQVYNNAVWTKPIVVLVDGGSASASEILAGAIQDNKAGTIVGTHTFGKASVQNIRELSDGSAILLTIAKYQTPLGHDIAKKGIDPDIKVELPKKQNEDEIVEYQEKDDVQLKKAEEIISNGKK